MKRKGKREEKRRKKTELLSLLRVVNSYSILRLNYIVIKGIFLFKKIYIYIYTTNNFLCTEVMGKEFRRGGGGGTAHRPITFSDVCTRTYYRKLSDSLCSAFLNGKKKKKNGPVVLRESKNKTYWLSQSLREFTIAMPALHSE